ncbi:MAG TPA: hypothetical protein VGX00_03480 [Thermoplasmata archaeon]|nr:hypothetical protein [Thermoplasmata archaeon]
MAARRGWFGFPKIDPEEKQRALSDPGPGWKEWAMSSFAKTYLALGFLIADGILVASWIAPGPNLIGLLGSAALALYLEYLLWQYLWYVPRAASEGPADPRLQGLVGSNPAANSEGDAERWTHVARRVFHPFPIGRWTAEARRIRQGLAPEPSAGPDPREFL